MGIMMMMMVMMQLDSRRLTAERESVSGTASVD